MLKNAPSDLQAEPDKLIGFFRGVVEDNNDPKKAGRVRVRVFGLHTENKFKTETDGIPTEELPWAEPCLPITEGSISGFGVWGVPLQGSHVMLFFENGNPSQPRYFASMPGIPESKNSLKKTMVTQPEASSKKEGFRDPDGRYPTDNRLGEPDVHRLARGVKDETLVTSKEENLDQAIQVAYGGSWDEPNPAYAAKYPHNFVLVTHGGLAVEIDSTPGAKRLAFYHPSNTYMEIDNNGVMVIRNQSDKYEIVIENKFVHINQDNYVTVEADERYKVKGNKQTEINENEERKVDGDRTTQIGGDEDKTVAGDETDTVQGELTITVTGKANIISSTEVNVTAPRINLN